MGKELNLADGAPVITDIETEPSRRACLTAILRMVGLRCTRQRLDLADYLIGRHRHITAEELHLEVSKTGQKISLATIYNTLRQFQSTGLIRELPVGGHCTVFDTDTSRHHHFYLTDEGRVIDIPEESFAITNLPGIPEDYEISRVEVVVRLRSRPAEG